MYILFFSWYILPDYFVSNPLCLFFPITLGPSPAAATRHRKWYHHCAGKECVKLSRVLVSLKFASSFQKAYLFKFHTFSITHKFHFKHMYGYTHDYLPCSLFFVIMFAPLYLSSVLLSCRWGIRLTPIFALLN